MDKSNANKMRHKRYFSLLIWILTLIVISSLIGSLTQSGVTTWYAQLNRSALTPPNYVFPVAWTVLYTMIAVSGWIIWCQAPFSGLKRVKVFYWIQLILNWSWTPLFFFYQLIEISLLCLIAIDITVIAIICLCYHRIKSIFWLMIPYLIWILFATYLNFYIWKYN